MARKVVLYTRVSTDDQKENGFSLQDQEARLRRHCQRKGFEVVAHYQDDHSAKNFKRPEFSRFLQDMKEKVIRPDLFLCVRMDRFSRNLEESLQMLARFKDLGLEFQTLENNYDLSQPENLIPYVLNMVLPQVDNERRGSKYQKGNETSKARRAMGWRPSKGLFISANK
jgi:site-specific DNA recombinase